MRTTKVPTVIGNIDVPVYKEEIANGLCVTMCQFGEFEVTHESTGTRIIGGFERAANAVVVMLDIYIATQLIGIDLDLPKGDVQRQFIESNEEHDHPGGLTIMQYINIHKTVRNFSGEFPWESFEESPFGKLEELKIKISKLKE